MKVIVSVQAKRASLRGLVHYIAHSKLDAERENAGREIFNGQSDEITVEKANSLLNNETARRRPSNEKLHHLVISLKSEDFERLGENEKERISSVKEITRHTIKRLEENLGAQRLDWAAGVHLNTDNPHVHIAINESYFDKNLEKKHLSKVPPQLLPHYEKNEAGEKIFVRGILIEAATEKLEKICQEKENERIAEKQKFQADLSQNQTSKKSLKSNEGGKSNSKSKAEIEKERDVLARAILAKHYLEKSKENLDSLVNHGDKRRFRIFDEISSKTRSISLFDLERRAEKRAARKIKTQNISDAVKKEELRKTLVEDEMQKNLGGIKRIKTILHNLVKKETGELKKREEDYKTVKPIAEKIRQNYRQENKKLPAPNLTAEELEMLQTETLEKKDFRVANYFERVRIELSKERNTPMRTLEQIQKLKANQTLSELRAFHFDKQSKAFNQKSRAFPVEIDGKKLTLSRVEELIEQRTLDEQKITNKISRSLAKIGLIERPSELGKLEETRSKIIEILSEKQQILGKQQSDEKALLATLKGFYEKDNNVEKETIQPKFDARELAEIESLTCSLKLPEVYRENWSQQKLFLADSGHKNESVKDVIAGRALARQVLSEIEVSRSQEDLNLFKKNKDFTKFEIINQKTGEAKFVSLSEERFDSRGSLFDQTLEYFLENREKRNTRREIEKLVKEKQIELKENLRDAKAIYRTTAEEARDYQTKSIFGAVKFTHEPLFTPKELITIELRINQTSVKSEAKNLQKIFDLADHSKAKNLSAILSGSVSEKEQTKKTETLLETSLNKANMPEKDEARLATKQSELRENITEILNQDRGR